MHEPIVKPMLRLLMVITDWEQTPKLKKLFEGCMMHFCYITKAEGTASSEILDMFGLGRSDKAMALCVVPQPVAEKLLTQITDILRLKKKGTGIAFTIPISGIAASFIKVLNEETQERVIDYMKKMENEVENMKCEISSTLIMSVIDQGYSDDLIEAAKSAGASGGTLLHARHLGDSDHLNFLGLPVQEEREIVFILTDRDHKKEIMKAINQKCGPKSDAHGITVALPVDATSQLASPLK